MPKIRLNALSDDGIDIDERPARPRGPRPRRYTLANAERSAVDGMNSETVFNPTFSSSRWERQWILDYLGPFYEDRHITDVLHQVKGGKEATVYCCSAHPSTGMALIAAKVYRPRMFRQLRNDARYRQGRALLDASGLEVLDERLQHAVQKKTAIGREVMHTSWIEHEYQTLSVLHAAGADVPRPLARGNNTILMEYLGEAGWPAPALNEITLGDDEVLPLYERLLRDVNTMLACKRVHGDLSAYNVLYWQGEVSIIDFPQAVDPATNPDAFDIFERDVTRLCEYFAGYGVQSDPAMLAREIWQRHGYGWVEPEPEE